MDPILAEALHHLEQLEANEAQADAAARAAQSNYTASNMDRASRVAMESAHRSLKEAGRAADAQRARVATIRRDLAGMQRHSRRLILREARA